MLSSPHLSFSSVPHIDCLPICTRKVSFPDSWNELPIRKTRFLKNYWGKPFPASDLRVTYCSPSINHFGFIQCSGWEDLPQSHSITGRMRFFPFPDCMLSFWKAQKNELPGKPCQPSSSGRMQQSAPTEVASLALPAHVQALDRRLSVYRTLIQMKWMYVEWWQERY